MTDLDRFKLFYNDIGVTYDRVEKYDPKFAPKDCYDLVNKALKARSGFSMRVFGAAHLFDEKENYVGSISNMTGQFTPRRLERK